MIHQVFVMGLLDSWRSALCCQKENKAMVPAVLEYIWVQFRLESGFMNCGCGLSVQRRSVSPLYLAFDRGHMLEGLYCHFIKFPATIHIIFYIDQIISIIRRLDCITTYRGHHSNHMLLQNSFYSTPI